MKKIRSKKSRDTVPLREGIGKVDSTAKNGGGGDLGVPGLLSHFPPKVGARQNDFGQKMLVIAGKSSGETIRTWRDRRMVFLLRATVKRKYARKLVCFVLC
jgi:hypothetical protein